MNVTELPIAFDCEGVPLIGIIHIPERPSSVGLLAVAAGGIQYRAGCGRQLVSLARHLAAQGTPVMRFDHRGHGDSVGTLLGFEHMEKDLARALEVFAEQVPELDHAVLYGGCEAASAIMINASDLPLARSAIVANPWVDSEVLRDLATRNHYLARIRDVTFWKKLFTGQYKLTDYMGGAWARVKKKLSPSTAAQTPAKSASTPVQAHFQDRMLAGFEAFDRPIVFLKSGMSIISDEFDLLVEHSKAWKQAYRRDNVSRIEVPDADQAFSTEQARVDLFKVAEDWIAQMRQLETSRDH